MTFLLLDDPSPFTSAMQAAPDGSVLALLVGALAGVSLFGGGLLLILALRRVGPRTALRASATEIVTIPPYSVRPPVPKAPVVSFSRPPSSPVVRAVMPVDELSKSPLCPPARSIMTDETGPASAVIMAAQA